MYLQLFAVVCLVAPLTVMSAPAQSNCNKTELDECLAQPMDLSFVIDSSNSINRPNFTEALWFVQNIIDNFNIGPDKVRVSTITYGSDVHPSNRIDFTSYKDKDSLKAAISLIERGEGLSTRTDLGIQYMLDKQMSEARVGVRRVAVVMTDGDSHRKDLTREQAGRARNSGIQVFAVGIGKVSHEELHNIASESRNVLFVDRFDQLRDVLSKLLYETCDVIPKPPCKSEPADIAFLIDSSVSVKLDNFKLGLSFIEEFIQDFTINPNTVRIAAVMFSDKVHDDKVIHFNSFNNKQDTIDAIQAFDWRHGGRTETGLGIQYLIDNFLPSARSHAALLGIVITDGDSQNRRATAAAAKRARDSGFTMIAVGVGGEQQIGYEELENIAGSRDRVLTATDYARLNLIRQQLIDVTCIQVAASQAIRVNALKG